jgi:hypothetical protein
VANSGESQHQRLQRFGQSLQRNQAWSGRRESNSRSQLGKESIRTSDLGEKAENHRGLMHSVMRLRADGRYLGAIQASQQDRASENLIADGCHQTV